MIGIINIGLYISIVIITIVYLIIIRENYEPDATFLTILILYFLNEIFAFIFFNLSQEILFTQEVALTLWYFSIITGLISVGLWSSFLTIELNKKSKVRYLPALTYILILGIIFSLMLSPNLFLVIQSMSYYSYLFLNDLLIYSIYIYYCIIITFSLISQIISFKNYSDRGLGVLFNYFGFFLIIRTIIYSLFLLYPSMILSLSFDISYFTCLIMMIIIIIKKPNFFVVFTNKIYDFIIFHKSGILLYSYNFQKNIEVKDSLLKGSILIGINHILNNFSDVENQLELIKLRDKGVIFQFNNDLGYATLLIAKHRNAILERAVNKFNQEFSEKFENYLVNLKGLIDISIFSDTKSLISSIFKRYIINNQ